MKTTEEKAKAYDEAKEKMHEIITMNDNPVRPTEIAKYLFPGLAESLYQSEDEKIRKEIIGYLNNRVATAEETKLLYFKRWITYLEKQKEQFRPDKCKGCNNVKGCINCVDGDQWAHIEEEQKPADLDETDYHWDGLIQLLRDYQKVIDRQSNNMAYEDAESYIDWIDKQKEQQPLSTEETELNSIAFLEQMGYTCIPPKKEHQNNSDAPKNALGRALDSPLDKNKNLDDIAQDYVEAVKEYNPEPTWNLMQTAVCYGYHCREEEEQKPTHYIPKFKVGDKVISTKNTHLTYDILEVGLINELGNPEYRVEILTDEHSDTPPNIKLMECQKMDSWGELIEQKPAEWSEEDEKALKRAIDCVRSWEIDYCDGDNKISERLQSLRPQPHWKPSKEQMEALNTLLCTGDFSYIGQATKLQELYIELKKLWKQEQ